MLQWYIICALADYFIYIYTSVLNNYQQCIFGIIARDDNLVKSDVKKCQQAFLAPLLGRGTRLKELIK